MNSWAKFEADLKLFNAALGEMRHNKSLDSQGRKSREEQCFQVFQKRSFLGCVFGLNYLFLYQISGYKLKCLPNIKSRTKETRKTPESCKCFIALRVNQWWEEVIKSVEPLKYSDSAPALLLCTCSAKAQPRNISRLFGRQWQQQWSTRIIAKRSPSSLLSGD